MRFESIEQSAVSGQRSAVSSQRSAVSGQRSAVRINLKSLPTPHSPLPTPHSPPLHSPLLRIKCIATGSTCLIRYDSIALC
ncbi:MAG: hypothetical protein KME42_18315 [Tildeniella nuda ZEHNDER 1965/U140]|nr:hypothetical protein [Tildeniella nuda ZEHNDER 1965/U140]